MSAKGKKWLSAREFFQRNKEIKKAYSINTNYEAIGKKFKLSGTRIKEIIQRKGYFSNDT